MFSNTLDSSSKNIKDKSISPISYIALVLFLLISFFSCLILFAGIESQRVKIDKNSLQTVNDGWYYYDDSGNKVYVDSLPYKFSESDSVSGKYKIYHSAKDFIQKENCYFTFYSHHQSFIVFLDSSEIFRFSNKTFPKNLKTYRAFYHLIKCPNILGNEISIEVEPSLSSKTGEFSQIEIGTEFEIISEHFYARKNRIILSIVFFILGLFLLIYSLIFRSLNTERSMFYLSLLMLFISFWQLEESRFLQFIISYQPLHWVLEYALQPLILILSFMFIREISSTKKEKTLLILFIIDCTAIVSVILLQIFGIMAMTESIILIQMCFIFSCLYIFILINKNFKFKNLFRRIVFCISILVGCLSFLLAMIFSGNSKIQVSNLTFIGFGFMFLSLTTIVGKRIYEQVTKIQVANEYESLSQVDSLSGVQNRNAWYHFTEQLQQSQKKYSESCLILFEMTNLKNINESFGYLCGDKVIKMIALFIKRATADTSTIYRIKGHIFACLGYICDPDFIS